jgi:phenylpropionate dioxygenase-like ring-hydroxylating dioxygenase large terminal subunit
MRTDINQLIQTGPGTLTGDLMRRYWVPALLASELPEPDCPPVRVTLMGEKLVAFRDTDDRVALVQEFCAHRHASLFFGRNEEHGLRCPYHGWKYDVTGQCVDMPSEPESSKYKERIKIVAYPARIAGDVVWAWMGEGDAPPLPDLEWAHLPAENRYVSKRWQDSNWLQALEGGIDSSHVSFVHRFNLADDPMHSRGEGNKFLKADRRPKFETAYSDGGLLIAARRDATDAEYYWRVTQFILPWYTLIPPFADHPLGGHAWVPVDDEACWVWNINFHPTRALTDEERADMDSGFGIHAALQPGSFRTVANADNDYLVDREAQRNKKTFSGIAGFGQQDSAIQESMGTIQDRSVEHLGTSDLGIMMARRRLFEAAAALRENGQEPPGREPAAQRVRAAAYLLARESPFADGVRDRLAATPGNEIVTL